jgi:hypothetical protein
VSADVTPIASPTPAPLCAVHDEVNFTGVAHMEKDDPASRGGFGPYANDPERESAVDRIGVKPSSEDVSDDPAPATGLSPQDEVEIEPQGDSEPDDDEEDDQSR